MLASPSPERGPVTLSFLWNGAYAGFLEDGKFVWSAPGEREVAGRWTLNGQLISVFNSGGSGSDPDASYRIIEYTGDTLHLRWHTQIGRSLLFRLYRA